MMQKAEALNESTLRTQEKTEKVFSRFVDATASVEPVYSAEELEQMSNDNLKAIQQRDVFAVINSILALVADPTSSLIMTFNFGTLPDGTMSFYVIAWENTEERETKLHEHADLSGSNALEQCIQMESKIAELIIEAKDNAEVIA